MQKKRRRGVQYKYVDILKIVGVYPIRSDLQDAEIQGALLVEYIKVIYICLTDHFHLASYCTSLFCMLHCNGFGKFHRSPLFTFVQFLVPNATAAPCFHYRYLKLSLRNHDISLRSLQFFFDSPVSFLTLSLGHPFFFFCYIITTLASLHLPTCLCLSAFSFL